MIKKVEVLKEFVYERIFIFPFFGALQITTINIVNQIKLSLFSFQTRTQVEEPREHRLTPRLDYLLIQLGALLSAPNGSQPSHPMLLQPNRQDHLPKDLFVLKTNFSMIHLKKY